MVNTFVDRVVDRVDQMEPTVEKGKKTLEKMAQITADGIGTVIDAAADHFAGIVNKEVNVETEKERVKATVDTLLDARDEVSGVDMDEEGINMLNYQKWYSASSRMLTTLDDCLDKLINGTGRVGL